MHVWILFINAYSYIKYESIKWLEYNYTKHSVMFYKSMEVIPINDIRKVFHNRK